MEEYCWSTFPVSIFENVLIECIHFSASSLARSVHLGTAAGSCCLVAVEKEHYVEAEDGFVFSKLFVCMRQNLRMSGVRWFMI